MSVRVLNDDDFHHIAAAALRLGLASDETDAERLGLTLLRMNLKAYKARYGISDGCNGFIHDPVFSYRAVEPESLSVLDDLVGTYLYNVYGCPDWPDSEAEQILQRLSDALRAAQSRGGHSGSQPTALPSCRRALH